MCYKKVIDVLLFFITISMNFKGQVYFEIYYFCAWYLHPKKYRPSARTPKSTYCLPPGIREPKVDKRVLRIRLVLFRVPAGVHVGYSVGGDTWVSKKQPS